MTVIEQMAKAEEYAALWATLMPNFGVPGTDQFALWCGQYPEAVIVRGVNRAAAKRRKKFDTTEPMSVRDAVRYAASVMRNEVLGIQRHEPETATAR